jgi:curved DNA-binding protein CbpA
MTETRDPYQILGVSRAAARHQIRAAYVARARGAHPDLVGGRGLDVMRALNEAWDILKDARRRSAYDAAAGGVTIEAFTTAATPGGGTSSVRHADQARPFWTGAMGNAPGRPTGPVLDYGIFAGWSIGEIARKDRGYLHWLRDRPEAKPIHQDIDRLLDPTAEDETKRRGHRR